MTHELFPCVRAQAIATGLERTGRAIRRGTQWGFIRLGAATGGFYWVSFDGQRVLRGRRNEAFSDAEPIQDGFGDAMVRAAGPVTSVAALR
jgi:hypothetical protein